MSASWKVPLKPSISETARATALAAIRDIMSAEVKSGTLYLNGRIDIADADGKLLAIVRFSEALEVRAEQEPA